MYKRMLRALDKCVLPSNSKNLRLKLLIDSFKRIFFLISENVDLRPEQPDHGERGPATPVLQRVRFDPEQLDREQLDDDLDRHA